MLFHGRDRNGKRHPLALAPCGSIRASGENGQHSGAQPLSGALQRQKGEPFALSVKPFGFASSPKGRAKTVVGTLLASFLKGHQGHTGSASCLSLWERWMRPTGADGEGAPAPLRGAAAAAAEGLSNRRSAKNAFSEAASIFPLRLLLWGLKGASSPFLVVGWVESRGASCTLRRKRSTLPSAINKFKRQRQKVETFSPISPFHCTRWQNVLK